MYHEANSEFLSASAYVSQCVIIVFCEMLIAEICAFVQLCVNVFCTKAGRGHPLQLRILVFPFYLQQHFLSISILKHSISILP